MSLFLNRRDVQKLAVGDDGSDLLDRHDHHIFTAPNRNPLKIRRLRQISKVSIAAPT